MALVHPSPRTGRAPRPLIRHPRSRCLVVSADGPLRRRIRGATSACGWQCVAPNDAAALAAAGVAFGLVFIDLVRPPAGVRAAVPRLVGAFADDHDTRVVVCGAVDRPHEEIWTRAEGVSVYLPGVVLGPEFSRQIGRAHV